MAKPRPIEPLVVTATVQEMRHAASSAAALPAPAAAGPGWRLGTGPGGAVDTQIDTEGAAADAGLSAGDVVVQVKQEKVAAPADVDRLIELARQHQRHYVALLVQRRPSGLRWMAMSVE